MKYISASVIAIGIYLASCNSKSEVASQTITIDKEQIKREIQAKEDSFAALYNRGELREIGYYADNAITYFQNMEPLVGKQKIIEYLRNNISSNTDRISYKTNEVFVSSDGNQVVEIGSYVVVDSANNPFNTGNYITLFQKVNGRYLAVRDMSAADKPVMLPQKDEMIKE